MTAAFARDRSFLYTPSRRAPAPRVVHRLAFALVGGAAGGQHPGRRGRGAPPPAPWVLPGCRGACGGAAAQLFDVFRPARSGLPFPKARDFP